MERARRDELQGLLRRLADGDRAALRPAYELLWPLLCSFCERALGAAFDSQDAAQRALLKVFARVVQLEPGRDPIPWVLAIAGFECRSARKERERRREEPEESLPAHGAAASPEDELIARDLIAAASEVLGTLSQRDQEILLALGDRPASATFRKRLQRALARFRAAWRARHGVE